MRTLYKKKTAVGEKIKCKWCHAEIIKNFEWQEFCLNKPCEDEYIKSLSASWRKKGVVRTSHKTYMHKCTCGKIFESQVKTAKYCSLDCQKLAAAKRYEASKKRKKQRDTMAEITDITRYALDEGLSYGQYVLKHKL